MNIESELNYLKARLEVTETVHATVLGICVRLMPNPEAILNALRTTFSCQASAQDAISSANLELLGQQYVQDAIDRIERVVLLGREEPPV